jgi:heterodisulfide reductase subunit A
MELFICSCRGEIEIPEKTDFGSDVTVHVESNLCSEEGREKVRRQLKNGSGLILAGCSPRIMEKLFPDCEAETVNIREQAHFVGHGWAKMKDLIQGAVDKVRVSKPIAKKEFPVLHKSALVIGGGLSGMEVAGVVARSGFEIYLVEMTPFLGGMVSALDRLYPKGTPNSHTLHPLINSVVTNPRVRLFLNAHVEEVHGEPGNYSVTLKVGKPAVQDCILCGRCEDVCPVEIDDHGRKRKAIYFIATHPDSYAIDFNSCTLCGKCKEVCPATINLSPAEEKVQLSVGAIVSATGLHQFDASRIKEYGYGKYEKVLTSLEFERKVASGEIVYDSVVIIHCAGSRDEKYLPYCSKICCLIGLKEAKLAKDRCPEAQVYVTYIDLRATVENFYRNLRDTYDVNFINGKPAEVFERDGKLVVRTEDSILDELLEIETDYVVLSTGFVPDEGLLQTLGFRASGVFPEEYIHSSLSTDSNPRGIYIAGSAGYPQNATESLISARDIASSVSSFLAQSIVQYRLPVATINKDVCGGVTCKLCVSTCPYQALYLTDEEVKVNEAACMGCGICAAACGVGANQLEGRTDEELLAQLHGMVSEDSIVAFLCKWSAYNAADQAGYERLSYPEKVRIIQVPCTGRVDPQLILSTFALGAKGVLLGGCYPDGCHYSAGNFKARRRVSLTKAVMRSMGIDPKRIKIEWIGVHESKKLVDIFNEIDD